ncbi:MAG: thioredoxin-disulfide reductase [Vallitaleaceae bacterium]|jgi:thioredoxin reductase (NADPH)|nr:thioredoxin-disulfide reductase [Vallitaleaceae bacterium]
MNEILDLVIIGAGPAGMTAALYASRAMLNFAIIEKGFPGGQVINTYEVDNYLGIKMTTGMELTNMFLEHINELGVEVKTEDVEEITIDGDIKTIKTYSGTYQAKTVILATGASWRKLGVEGEARLAGRGVSYCATCDGAFYKGKDVMVVGGGDVAVEDAIYLSRMCKKVTIIHRRDEFRAVKVLQEKLFKVENIEVLWFTELEEILGDEVITGARVINNQTKEVKTIEVDGVFVAVGNIPNTGLLAGKVDTDSSGWIIADENCETSVPGIFAAGDLRVKSLRQIVTASADGAISVFAAEKYV